MASFLVRKKMKSHFHEMKTATPESKFYETTMILFLTIEVSRVTFCTFKLVVFLIFLKIKKINKTYRDQQIYKII